MMAVKTVDEIMGKVRERIGEDDSDEAIGFIEDISDTLESFSNAEDWKTKYEENDKKWREKYRDRFFTSKEEVEEDDIEEPEEKEKKKFEDLFE
jgi:hypothetical protein|nr:MAG TPA: hypothetical protein [Caudoviricetes sp.]